jgi:hypothetical protein
MTKPIDDIITLWHGTNKTNFKGILRRGFRSGTWFAQDEQTARQYGLMACKRESSLVLMMIQAKKSDFYYNGYYVSKKVLNLKDSIYQ